MTEKRIQKHYTAAMKAELKEKVVELRAQAVPWDQIAQQSGVALRTLATWRQQDETFAVACASADGRARDFLENECRNFALEEAKPGSREKMLMLMFMLKQRDPSYRENAKIEHTVSPGLAGTLKAFAKLGRA